MNGELEIVEIAPADTHALRRAVLRNGDPDRSVVYPEDDWPAAVHLGVRDANRGIVATSSWVPKQLDGFDEFHGLRAVQLRGMATTSGLQGTGVGSRLFEAAAQRWTEAGYELLWARARDTALAFYAQHGCRLVGDGFVDETSGLDHHIVVRELID